MVYKVTIQEILSKSFTLEAESEIEAIKKIESLYNDEKIVLTADDFVGKEIFATKEDFEYVHKAVKFWRKKIEDPTFDNGEDLPNLNFIEKLYSDTIKNEKIDKECYDKFEEVLFNKIIEDIKKHNYNTNVYLEVDYNPCKILEEAATESGIPLNRFPWKTSMTIQSDIKKVSVSEGHFSPLKEL